MKREHLLTFTELVKMAIMKWTFWSTPLPLPLPPGVGRGLFAKKYVESENPRKFIKTSEPFRLYIHLTPWGPTGGSFSLKEVVRNRY